MTTLCQECGKKPRKPKERYCARCGAKIRAEARRRAWQLNPDPYTGPGDERGRKGRGPDQSTPIEEDEE